MLRRSIAIEQDQKTGTRDRKLTADDDGKRQLMSSRPGHTLRQPEEGGKLQRLQPSLQIR
jgi:hypothetical protein